MSSDDPYQILGVSRDASASEIKRAYRQLALEYHPDHNPGDEEAARTFRRVSWAYELLSDPRKRRRYDRGGLGGLERGRAGGDFSVRRGLAAFREIVEMFGSVFRGEGRRRPIPGEDFEASLSLDLEDVLQGATVELEVPAQRSCARCGGDGAAEGSEGERCSACDGRGQVRAGLMGLLEECDRCGGTGTIPGEACGVCGGSGRERYRREVQLEVPAGVRHGQTLRRAGEGAPGRFGGTAGDLLVDVEVELPPELERSGRDLHREVSVPFTKASLGGRVRVPTVDGDVWMQVPSGTASGERFRLRGRGLPGVGSEGRGDQLVTVRVETPVDLTERQRERIEERDERGERESRSIGRRIRDFLTGTG